MRFSIRVLTILCVLAFLAVSLPSVSAVTSSGGGGGTGATGTAVGAAGVDYIDFGKYHNLVWPGDSPAYISPGQTDFYWRNYPMGDPYDSTYYATVAGEPVSESKSEVPSVAVNFENIYSGGTVTMKWYKASTGELLYSYSHTIPDPSDEGYDYWSWYSIFSWIGKFSHEIDTPGQYYVEINSPWKDTTRHFNVIEEQPDVGFTITGVQAVTAAAGGLAIVGLGLYWARYLR